MYKKVWMLLLSLCLLVGLIPTMAMAADEAQGTSGGIAWSIAADGTLTISPAETTEAGKMPDYTKGQQPWTNSMADIKTIIIEDGVTNIGNHAFNGASSLEKVEMADSVVSIGLGGFADTSHLQSMTLSPKLETIGQYAFTRSGLASITIPDSVTKIDQGAFQRCPHLTNVTIGSGVQEMGNTPFYLCPKLEKFEVSLDNPTFSSIDGVLFAEKDGALSLAQYPIAKAGETYAIPDGVTEIGYRAFSGNANLQQITDWNDVTTIGVEAFYVKEGKVGESDITNSRLTSVDFSNSLVSTVEESAFRDCKVLASVKLGENITEVPANCFNGCTSLADVDYGSATTIGERAFQNTALKKIEFPDTVTTIGQYAFANHSADVIVLGSGISSVDEFAFSNSPEKSYAIDATRMSDSIQVTNWANAFKNNKPNSDIPRYFYFSSDNVYGRIDERPVYAITNGGTFAEDTNFASDALATPIKDGYIFDGWYTKNGVENNDWGNPVSKIEADGHYYAKWTPSNDYSINDKSVALEMTYGDDAISKTVSVTGPENDASIKDATSSSKAFEVSRDGMTVTITAADGLNAGTYTGTVYVYTGDGASHRIDVSLTVKKAMLNATYQGETIRVGETPALTVEVKGFVNGETADTATGYTAPTVSTDKTAVGSYELTPVGGEATNYDFEYVPGTLTIEVAPSTGPATYAIGVADADHGTVAVNPTKAVRGKTVTITAKADAGYEVDAVKVTNRNGKAVKVTANSDGTYSFTMPASKVDVSVSFKAVSVDPQPQPTPENPFTDVADDAFYHDAVLWAVDNKITNGTSATTFSPNLACTRAQMICFLWNQAGQPAPKGEEMPFTDVAEGTYYHDAVQWAVEEGLAAGTSSTTFSPNATLTRGQTVTFLWRAAGEPAVNADNSFTDVADSAYYADAVAWAVENGVTNGTATNTFSPDADCTRGQIVTFLWRAAK